MLGGYFILPHPVVVDVMRAVTGRAGSVEIAADGMRQNWLSHAHVNAELYFTTICRREAATIGDTIFIVHAYGSVTNCSPCWPASTANQRLGLVTLTFYLLTLKVVSESRVTWATSVPILVFLGFSVLDVGPMYAIDIRQAASSLNALAYATGGA